MSATAPSSEPLVQVEGLHTYYGKSHILHGVTLEVGRGEVVGLIGRNGVGKSTTLKTIMRCAIDALLAVKPAAPFGPGNAVPSRPLIGNVVAAPNVAKGVKPGSPKPLDFVLRNSTPPLKACFP